MITAALRSVYQTLTVTSTPASTPKSKNRILTGGSCRKALGACRIILELGNQRSPLPPSNKPVHWWDPRILMSTNYGASPESADEMSQYLVNAHFSIRVSHPHAPPYNTTSAIDLNVLKRSLILSLRRDLLCPNHQPLLPPHLLLHCPPLRPHHHPARLQTCIKTRSTLKPSGLYKNMEAQVLASLPRRSRKTLFRTSAFSSCQLTL